MRPWNRMPKACVVLPAYNERGAIGALLDGIARTMEEAGLPCFAVAVNATCCRVMGINPERIEYPKLAEERGQTREENVEQIGEPTGKVQTRFELLKGYGALRL